MERDGRFVAGEGRVKLLHLIEETGSISEAAKRMEMSYRHAWGIIKNMEEALGDNLVISHRGGREGGKTELTSEARGLLEKYGSEMERLEKTVR